MVLTFSRKFPFYHPRKGEPTYFVEKIVNQVRPGFEFGNVAYLEELMDLNEERIRFGKLTPKDVYAFWLSLVDINHLEIEPKTKSHTIRGGHRFNAGDKFSPRVWSGQPYNSPQIQFLPEMEVKYVNDFVKTSAFLMGGITVMGTQSTTTVAVNDGLTFNDFTAWFNKSMAGQIICLG